MRHPRDPYQASYEGETAMHGTLKAFLRDERGEDLIEYGLLVAFAASVVVAVIISDPIGIKPAVVSAFVKVKNAITGM
jgi:Flp pilus assembly pilin Flp